MTSKCFKVTLPAIVGLAIVMLVSACSKGKDEKSVNAFSGPVLVKVNGTLITRRDVDIAAIRMLGARKAFEVDSLGRQKILESLVLSRIISQQALSKISVEDKDRLERQVRDYREELLVKEYLRKHIKPKPITQAMLQQYYDEHPEQFGGGIKQEYIALTVPVKSDGKLRNKIFKAFTDAKQEKNWSKYAKKLNRQGLKVELKVGKTSDKLLDANLREKLIQMKKNETSKLFLLQGKQYVLRVTNTIKSKPRKLTEVSAEIRQAVAPKLLKEEINKITEQLKQTAKIEYLQNE